MNRTATTSDKLAPPAGPYSHVVEARGFVCTAGLGPQAATGAVLDRIRGQADQAIRNLETALAAVGLTLADVIKTTVHLAGGRGDFTASTGLYRQRFPETSSVRTTVGSQLPGILIEIGAVAARPS
jgi:2-iminobutanoate/2-iminopropanoate deaminase